MATTIVDYPSLQSAVANWMARAGNADLVANIPDFVAFAEARINFGSDDPDFLSPPLRVAQMEIAATTLTFLASTNSVTLPRGMLQPRRAYVSGNPIQKLTYVTPNQMDSALAAYPNGPPEEFYTIMGGAMVLASAVNTAMSVVVGGYVQLPSLSTSNTVNWLLAVHPGLYLAGAMLEASLFIGGDDQEAAKWARIFTAHIRSFQKQDLKGRYGGDALQMKTDTGNP